MGVARRGIPVRLLFSLVLTDIADSFNALMLMMDGHFGLQRLSKVDDPDDISFLDGWSLFPRDEKYNDYVYSIVAYSEEVSVD